MKPKTSHQIGKKFANWCNDTIEEMGLGKAVLTPGSGSGTRYKGDSFNLLNFLLEYKSERNPQWKGNIAQAKRQAEIGNYDSDKWALIQRDPNSPQENPQAFAIIEYVEFLKLLKRNKEPLIKEPDREAKFWLGRLKDTIKQVEKRLWT